MCLLTNKKEPSIAKSDIVCYKVLLPYKEYDVLCGYITMYRRWSIPGGKNLINKELEITMPMELPNKRNTFRGNKYVVEATFIHTFKRIIDVKRALGCYLSYYTIFKCIIPAGTKYYAGIFPKNNEQHRSYASRKIIFKEKVNIETT